MEVFAGFTKDQKAWLFLWHSFIDSKNKTKKRTYFTSVGLVSVCCVSQQREGKGQSLNWAGCFAGSLFEFCTQGLIRPFLVCPSPPLPCFPLLLTGERSGKERSREERPFGPRISSTPCHRGNLPEEKMCWRMGSVKAVQKGYKIERN